MNNEKKGRYERSCSVEEAEKALEAEWKKVRREEEKNGYQRRKRKVLLVTGLILTAAGLLGMIHHDLIHQLIGEVFLVAATFVFGFFLGK